MRIANFKDDVLWAIAYKAGLDPAQEFLTDEGESTASYINAWLRRTWEDRDWPEWAQTLEFTPDARHVVAYHSVPVGAALPVYLSRPLKVFLVDPLLSPYPIDTPFRLVDDGLHVGFDHGQTVWIRFLPPTPKFTSIKWDANRTYDKGEVTYSPEEGDCFTSRIHNNQGNDPSLGYTQAIPSEITQKYMPPQPGVTGQPQKVDAYALPAGDIITGVPTLPSPGQQFAMTIQDKPGGGGVVIASAFYTVPASPTWSTIITGIGNALRAAPGLSAFTITDDVTNKKVTLQSSSNFRITNWALQGPGPTQKFQKQVQTQIYIADVPPFQGQAQITELTIGQQQVIACADYLVTFIDLEGGVHSVEYTSIEGDDVPQILLGLAAAISGSPDTFFQDVVVNVDTTVGTIDFLTLGGVAIDATVSPESSAFWDKVYFPYALVEPVVRGAYADVMREAGQTDKAMAEEQGAIQEDADRANKAVSPAYDSLIDQQRPAPRYTTRPAATAAGK